MSVRESIIAMIMVMQLIAIAIAYYQSKSIRLKKEQAILQRLIIENSNQYSRITNANQELNEVRELVIKQGRYAGKLAERTRNLDLKIYAQELERMAKDIVGIPLCGNLIIDATFSRYYRLGKSKNVFMDIMPESIPPFCKGDEEVAILLENVFRYVFFMLERIETERWIVFRMRKQEDSWILKIQFTKPIMEKRMNYQQMLDEDRKRRTQMLKVLKKSVKRGGIVLVRSTKEETEIKILVPQLSGKAIEY